MLRNFQLTAIVKRGAKVQLYKIPMHQTLQHTLAATWQAQRKAFLDDTQEIEFNAGYEPEAHERFALPDFEPPDWLAGKTSATVGDLDPFDTEKVLNSANAVINGIAGFAQDDDDSDLVLFQNFSRSHVIKPGIFLLLRSGTYETNESPGLTLDTKLAAAHFPSERKLLFRSYRAVNSFLPLGDHYAEASEQQIRELMAHKKLAPVDVEATATQSNQWFRKRVAMLRDSGVLDQYSPEEIQTRSAGFDVDIQVANGKLIFPADRPAAKKLLQFLNEELFRGAITATLFETNSKRVAD